MYKPQDISHAGIPDLILCVNGFFVAIELKVPGNTTTQIQDVTLDKILEAGGRTAVCYSVTDVRQFFEETIR